LKAFFPGTFDPLTNGHLDIVERASAIFDEVVVGVYRGSEKDPLFSSQERLQMVSETVERVPNVSAVTYDGLTVEFARSIGARVVVRGLRALSDFEYEFSLSSMNQVIESDVETVCLLTSPQFAFISSSLVREIASLGQPVNHWVPRSVAERLRAKLELNRRQASLRE
jgi:pantetheine-phosphate adenylyltransferase